MTRLGEKKTTSVSVPPPKKVKDKATEGETPKNGNKVKDAVEKAVI